MEIYENENTFWTIHYCQLYRVTWFMTGKVRLTAINKQLSQASDD